MANPEHLSQLKKGPSEWNVWRTANPEIVPDLSGADLSRSNLRGVNLVRADLSAASLHSANLSGADLSEANLRGANLQHAYLGMYLGRFRVHGASLRKANLVGASFDRATILFADLSTADLSGAGFNGTIFANTNLNDVQGLDACVHYGPSTIDHRTIAASGPLPLAFLRGCGLPDELIKYLSSLLNQAIQFYSCFISHSTKDQAFANRLHTDLQNKGVRCWLSTRDIQGGKKIHEQIDEAIRVYDRLLLILSDTSMNSEWVKTEIANARQKERNDPSKRVLFPISLVPFETIRTWKNFDADTGKDSAREIREYYIPDFSDWKNHDNYQTAFELLIRDLKAETQVNDRTLAAPFRES